MPAKRLLGSCTPGRRVSSARFATVSSPVYASIASGRAKTSSCHVGELPSETSCVSAPGDQSSARPSTTSSSCVNEVDRGDADAGRVHPLPAREPRDADERHDAERDDLVPRARLERFDADRAAEVVRQEQRRERGHDQVVEEERPARDEPGEVVERAADERRGAARLPQLRRAFGVRQRDDEEEQAGEEEDERRQAERVAGDDPEREVDASSRSRRTRRRTGRPRRAGAEAAEAF